MAPPTSSNRTVAIVWQPTGCVKRRAAALFVCTGRVKLRCVAVVDGGGGAWWGRIVLRLGKIAVTVEGYTEVLDDITREAAGRRLAVGENSQLVGQRHLVIFGVTG